MLYLGILTVFPQQVRVSQMHTSFVLLLFYSCLPFTKSFQKMRVEREWN